MRGGTRPTFQQTEERRTVTNVRRALIIVVLGAALLFLSDRFIRSPAPSPPTPSIEVAQPEMPVPAATTVPEGYPRPPIPTPTEGPYPPPTPVPTPTPEGYVPPPR